MITDIRFGLSIWSQLNDTWKSQINAVEADALYNILIDPEALFLLNHRHWKAEDHARLIQVVSHEELHAVLNKELGLVEGAALDIVCNNWMWNYETSGIVNTDLPSAKVTLGLSALEYPPSGSKP